MNIKNNSKIFQIMKRQLKKIALVLTFSVCSVAAALACSGTLYFSNADFAQAEKQFYANCPEGSSMTIVNVHTGEDRKLKK